MKVHIAQTPSGYLPTLQWGEGADVQRETYPMAYDSLETAERIARTWANEQGAEYIPFRPVDQNAIRKQSLLVKQLREEEGLSLPAAIARAREILADESRDQNAE